jgi:hypothetical protein
MDGSPAVPAGPAVEQQWAQFTKAERREQKRELQRQQQEAKGLERRQHKKAKKLMRHWHQKAKQLFKREHEGRGRELQPGARP